MRINLHINRNFGNKPITNRRTSQTCRTVSIIGQSDVTGFLSPSRPQRATTRAFCLVHEHPSDSNASIYLSASETAVLRTFLPFPAQVLQTQTSRTASGPLFYVLEEAETKEGEYGFWVLDEETGEEGFTGLYTENEFWVLGAKGSYSKRRIYGLQER